MNTYGLIGYPLEHSFSKTYFTQKFIKEKIKGCNYLNFPIQTIQELPALLESEQTLKGLNVTIPYKESVIEYVDELAQEADEIDAVNCIKIVGEKLIGYNTDFYGFQQSLKPLLKPYHTDALILGSGGSSKAVKYALDKLGIDYKVASSSRNGDYNYAKLTDDVIVHNLLIINTTPLGMFPLIKDAPPINYKAITPRHLLFDLIYNPTETQFLKHGREQGATTKNGLEMLELQAEKSWEIWNRNS